LTLDSVSSFLGMFEDDTPKSFFRLADAPQKEL
jgi:hypothetical protein